MIKYNIADIDFACISPIVDIDFACIGNGVTPIAYDIDIEFSKLNLLGNNQFTINGTQITTDKLQYKANLADIGITEPITSFTFSQSFVRKINSFPDTSNVTNMSRVFDGCTDLEEKPDIEYPSGVNYTSTFNMTKINESLGAISTPDATMMYMQCNDLISSTCPDSKNLVATFGYCSNLEKVRIFPLQPTTTQSMFYGCAKLNELNSNGVIGLQNIDWSKVTSTKDMFRDCKGLTSFSQVMLTSNGNYKPSSYLTNASGMFNGTNLDPTEVKNSTFPLWRLFFSNAGNLTDISGIFANTKMGSRYHCDDNLNVFKNSLTNVSRVFENCTEVRDIFITYSLPNVTNISRMFAGCSSLNYIFFSSIDSTVIENYSGMFEGCTNLATITMSYTPSCEAHNAIVAALEEAGIKEQVTLDYEIPCSGSGNDGNSKALAFRINDYSTSSFIINGNTVTYSSSDNDGLFYKTTDELETDYGTVESLDFSGGIKQIISLPSSGLRDLAISYTSSSYLDFSYLNLNEMYEIRLYENSNLIHLDLSNWQNIGMNLDIYACPEIKTIKALNCSDEVLEYIRTKISDEGLDAIVITEDNNTYITTYSSVGSSNAYFDGSTQPLQSPVTDINDWGYESFSDHSVQGLFQGNDSIFGVYNLPSLSATTGHYAMFEGCAYLEFQDLTKFVFDSTYGDQDISSLFKNCYALEWVNFSGLDLSSAYNEYEMFASCNNLKWVFAWGCNEDTISKLQYAIDNNGNSIQLIY